MKQETQGGTPATPQEQAHLDDVKRTEPMETTEQCVMSRKEAASVLMDMAGGGASRRQICALQLAVRSLVKRHFDCMKNRARRKATQDE